MLAALGLAYISYLFVLACIVLREGVPDETAYFLNRVSPEASGFALSSSWGLLPLAGLFVVILVLARTSRSRAESQLPYMFLIVGFPLATVAYFVWYRMGW